MEPGIYTEFSTIITLILNALREVLVLMDNTEAPTEEQVRSIRKLMGIVNRNAGTLNVRLEDLGWTRPLDYFYPSVNAL